MPEGWSPPPRGWTLGADEVHVWRASLALPAGELERHARILAIDERSRAERFRFPVHRDRFIAGRGIQRRILAGYLGVEPAAIVYHIGKHGKLSVDATEVRFNVSNAGDRLLLAVALGREIGVDLEEVRAMPDAAPIARRFFSSVENEAFAAVPPDARDRAFFTCWTRKEAFIKAVGEGLSRPLDSFDVTLRAGEPAQLLCTRRDPADVERWTLREIDVGPGWAAALAVEGGPFSLHAFDWDSSS